MSSWGKGGAAAPRTRVAIPSSVKKTIDDIKEITGQNHGDDEIYAMLKECSMDPNETAQKLLLLDAFHEVKKRRDRRRENPNKEPAQLRRRQGSQAQVNRASHENYSYRPLSHDAGGGRNSFAVKENLTSQFPEKVVGNATLGNTQKIKSNEASSVSSPVTGISDCPSGITSQSTNSNKNGSVWASGNVNKFNGSTNSSMSKLEESLPLSSPVYSNKNVGSPGPRDIRQNEMLDSSNRAVSLPRVSASGSQSSPLDPLLSPSQDIPHHSTMDTISSDVGSNHILVEQNANNHSERYIVSTVPQKMPNDFPGVGQKQHLVQTASSRPASNDNILPQVIVPQKVGPGKEWKPKSTNSSIDQVVSAAASYEGSAISVGNQPELQQAPSEKASPELQRMLEELHISDIQQVVLPNHVHVPEAGKLGFCFGSFDASFGLEMTQDGSVGSDKSTPHSESSDSTAEPTEVLQLRGNAELIYPDRTHSHSHSREPEDLSPTEVEVISSDTYHYGEPKQEVSLQGHQHAIIHTASSYNYGYLPPLLNGQLRLSENSESQVHGALPGFPMQQSFDPVSYHAQFYRSGVDGDGRCSPLNSAGAANNYNGNVGLISAKTSQSPQEGTAPLFISAASPVPLVTQAAGVIQSSISANQQPLPVFHQPAGIHLPHYPPFIPYAPYFSPVYVPPHAIHQFFSSGTFPQQPHGGNLYPNPHGTTAKYSISQNEQGSNAPYPNHVGVPVNYVPYSIPLANHTSSSVTEALNSTSNEEVKENNMYASEQQTEGQGVCLGQPPFAPTQPAQGSYAAGIFHPAHALTASAFHPVLMQQSQPISIPINMVGPTGVYPPPPQQQQQQHTQLNY
ncbi:GBF-interacting protein 1-like [Salvia miltiorrhiza]|uniref:GBF-interacting protein 1-like n=1 Tax=Salvia miltiorrhiza TaxID=226208 RepID=UPI0025AC9210|nr:GBF-interacting protein 1-like [Salvia miltiorrhiza]